MSETWMRRLMFQAYVFVLGVAVGKLHPLPPAQASFCFALFAILLALSLFGYVRARRGRFPAMAATVLFGLSCFFLGWGRFSETQGNFAPGHISAYASDSWKTRASIEGVIVTDPEVFDDRVTFTVNPIRARKEGMDEFDDVSGGRVEVSVRRTAKDLYRQFGQSSVYGWRIRVNAPLLIPPDATNPYGFSYRDFLADQDVYAVQTVTSSWGAPPPIEVLDQGEGIFLTEWALEFKEKMMAVFVRTIPYPESTFLAGVTLGLQSALKDVSCIVPGHDMLVVDEFRVAGVSHVLAVSGFHVTIISAVLLGVLSAFKLPLRVQAPIVIFVLVIFLIITGMAPSAMRATLMNSLALFFLAVSRGGFRISILFSIAEAAMIVLLVNPKNIVQPSFTLSFAAVLSLALVSPPVEKLLRRLRGPALLWAAGSAVLLTVLSTNIFWENAARPAVYVPLLAFLASGFVYCLTRFPESLPGLSFERCPEAVRFFIVAQVAILVGMIFPLSSFYFGRYPLGGPYANLIAIPLSGIILPIGMLAGLVGMIPDVGMFLALILNAANDVFTKIFFYVTHATTVLFPYPFIKNLTLNQLCVYYTALAAFVWWESLYSYGMTIYNKYYKYAPDPRMKRNVGGVGVVLALFALLSVHQAWSRPPAAPPGILRVTFLSTTFGGSAVIQSPGGKVFVVDGSLNNRQTHTDAGERVIAPFLLKQGIKSIDAALLTNTGPEHTEGLRTILEGFDVGVWYDPAPLRDIKAFLRLAESDTAKACRMFLEDVGAFELQKKSTAPYVQRICDGYASLVKAQERRNIRRIRAAEGVNIVEEQMNGTTFRMAYLGPSIRASGMEEASGVVLVEYGSFAVLFTGDIGAGASATLASSLNGSADVLVLPQHGLSAAARAPEWIQRARPWAVVFQAGNPVQLYGKSREAKPLVDRAKEEYDANRAYYEEKLGADRVFDPKLDWAVVAESDGKRFQVRSLKSKSAPGPEDHVTKHAEAKARSAK